MIWKCNDNDNIIELVDDEVYIYTEGSTDKLVISLDDLQSSVGVVLFWLIKKDWDMQRYEWQRADITGNTCKRWLMKKYPFFKDWLDQQEE